MSDCASLPTRWLRLAGSLRSLSEETWTPDSWFSGNEGLQMQRAVGRFVPTGQGGEQRPDRGQGSNRAKLPLFHAGEAVSPPPRIFRFAARLRVRAARPSARRN